MRSLQRALRERRSLHVAIDVDRRSGGKELADVAHDVRIGWPLTGRFRLLEVARQVLAESAHVRVVIRVHQFAENDRLLRIERIRANIDATDAVVVRDRPVPVSVCGNRDGAHEHADVLCHGHVLDQVELMGNRSHRRIPRLRDARDVDFPTVVVVCVRGAREHYAGTSEQDDDQQRDEASHEHVSISSQEGATGRIGPAILTGLCSGVANSRQKKASDHDSQRSKLARARGDRSQCSLSRTRLPAFTACRGSCGLSCRRSYLSTTAGRRRSATFGSTLSPSTSKPIDFSSSGWRPTTLLAFDRLRLDLNISSVWRAAPSFGAIEIDRPYLRTMIRADGSLNLADLAKPFESQRATLAGARETPLRLFVDRLTLTGGATHFEDPLAPDAVRGAAEANHFRAARLQHDGQDGQRLLARCVFSGR